MRRQFQVVFQGALLLGRHALDADANQRIVQEPLFIQFGVADLAHPELPVINALQRCIHFLQQLQRALAMLLGQHFRQPFAPGYQLVAHRIDVHRFTRCHG